MYIKKSLLDLQNNVKDRLLSEGIKNVNYYSERYREIELEEREKLMNSYVGKSLNELTQKVKV